MRSVTDASELRLRRSRPQYVLDESEPECYVTYCHCIKILSRCTGLVVKTVSCG